MKGVCGVAMCSSAVCEAVPQVQLGYCACILSGARGKMRVDRVDGFVFLPMISSGYGIRKRW